MLRAHNLEERVRIILLTQCKFQQSHSTWKGHWALKHGPPCDCKNWNIAWFVNLKSILWMIHSLFQQLLGNVFRMVQSCVVEYVCQKFGPLHSRTTCDFVTQGGCGVNRPIAIFKCTKRPMFAFVASDIFWYSIIVALVKGLCFRCRQLLCRMRWVFEIFHTTQFECARKFTTFVNPGIWACCR